MDSFNKELNKYYNFGKPFFKENYKLNYGDFKKNRNLNMESIFPKEVRDIENGIELGKEIIANRGQVLKLNKNTSL